MLQYMAVNMGLKKSKLYPAMQLAHQPRHDKAGNGTRVGLGWHISAGAEGDITWHNGGTGGYRSFAGFVGKTGKGVVVLTNSSTGADDIGFRLLSSTAKLIEVKKSAALAIKKAFDTEPIAVAVKTVEALRKDKKNHAFEEDEINMLGYSYLQSGKLAEALAVFKINVEEFPNSFNAYDSYGEALMKDGQKEAAIVNYKKSLELNPGNSNAVDMLAKMGVAEAPAEWKLPVELLDSYVGVYELAPSFTITITRENNQLFGQATGQSRFEMFAKSESEFYLKIVSAQITFSSKNGKVESMTLFQNGQIMPGKRIK
jgi:tetratricopeptide (TPR) repeat protein